MSKLCIQIQPSRAPNLDLNNLRSLCQQLASTEKLVDRFQTNEGFDQISYLNILFDTATLFDLWQAIQTQLYENTEIGADLGRASIATCEGDKG